TVTVNRGVDTITGLNLGNSGSSGFAGGTLTMWGGTKAGNNGTFPITSVSSKTTVVINDANGASDGNNGRSSFHWAAAGPNGALAAGFVGGTVTLTGGSTSGTFSITGSPSSTSVTVSGLGATTDPNNGQSALTWTA